MMRKIRTLILLLLLLPQVKPQLRASPYLYSGERVENWRRAQDYCRRDKLDMVTIRNEKENEILYGTKGWLGLYRENSTSEWKWSRMDELAYFFDWKNGEPDDEKNCVYKEASDTKWYSDYCSKEHYPLCTDEKLILVMEDKTWEEALIHCRSLEAKNQHQPVSVYDNYLYDLASVITLDDYIFALEKTESATVDEVWIGLRYLAGQWLWVGGETVTLKYIQTCPSDGFCGTLQREIRGFHEIRSCTEKRKFLCYRKN